MINITKKLFELEFYGGAKRKRDAEEWDEKEWIDYLDKQSVMENESQKQSEIHETPEKKYQPLRTASLILSPETGYIFDMYSPDTKKRLKPELVRDSNFVRGQETEEAEDKYTYEEDYDDDDLSPNQSKLIEYWVALNLQCPECKKKQLRPYSNNSMPTYDLVCTNCKCKVQVKTQKQGSTILYFNANIKEEPERPQDTYFATTGAYGPGKVPHSIWGQHDPHKLKVYYYLIQYALDPLKITDVFLVKGPYTYLYPSEDFDKYEGTYEEFVNFRLNNYRFFSKNGKIVQKPIVIFESSNITRIQVPNSIAIIDPNLIFTGGAIKYKIHYSENQ